jgi:uncharacterized membrane protein (UPF0127 family)
MFAKINDYKIKVIPCENNSEGMMNKKFDSNFLGMLFYLTPGPQSFWMKDCITPLDIIFISDDKITKIARDCQPCDSEECPHYECDNADMVLEVPGSMCDVWGISEGDSVKII